MLWRNREGQVQFLPWAEYSPKNSNHHSATQHSPWVAGVQRAFRWSALKASSLVLPGRSCVTLRDIRGPPCCKKLNACYISSFKVLSLCFFTYKEEEAQFVFRFCICYFWFLLIIRENRLGKTGLNYTSYPISRVLPPPRRFALRSPALNTSGGKTWTDSPSIACCFNIKEFGM